MEQSIDKLSAIHTVLELINSLTSSKNVRADLESARQFVYSLEDILPINIILELYELISHIEIYIHHLNKNIK